MQDGISTDMGQFPGDKTGTSAAGQVQFKLICARPA